MLTRKPERQEELIIQLWQKAICKLYEIQCRIHNKYRDVSAGATGATAVTPKFSDTLTLSQPGGQILTTIAEVEPKFPPWLRP